jgi:hypothetical protein
VRGYQRKLKQAADTYDAAVAAGPPGADDERKKAAAEILERVSHVQADSQASVSRSIRLVRRVACCSRVLSSQLPPSPLLRFPLLSCPALFSPLFFFPFLSSPFLSLLRSFLPCARPARRRRLLRALRGMAWLLTRRRHASDSQRVGQETAVLVRAQVKACAGPSFDPSLAR